MKRIMLFALILCSFSIFAQDFVYNYIDNYSQIAIDEMNRTGIPASITLAQGMLESNWGRSDLAKDANNHFGIKCGSKWDGDTFKWEDDDYKSGKLIKSCFRVYNSPEESFMDHSDFLSKKRYQFLYKYDVTNYKSWAKGLSKAGYATDPKYVKKLIMIIEKYGLFEYDLKYNPVGYVSANTSTQVNKNNKYSISYINNSRVVLAKKGDTPKSLAKKVGISSKKILKYNENIKKKNYRLKEGDIVFLEKKRKRYYGVEEIYIASRRESLLDISQKFGIDLKYLARINKTKRGKIYKKGQRLVLKPISYRIDEEAWVSNSKKDKKYLFDAPLSPKN